MFNSICDRIFSSKVLGENMEAERREEYAYGMNLFLNSMFNIATLVVIGLLTGMLYQCVVFCIIYKTIREYTGGYHCKTAGRCYVASCITYLTLLGIIKFMPMGVHEMVAGGLISTIVIWFISPVEAENKPLEEIEKQVFRKRARRNVVIIFIVCVLCLFISVDTAKVIVISTDAAAAFAVLGKMLSTANAE